MYNKHTVGSQYEQLAVEYLVKHGFEIVARNFRCGSGEIDIISKEEEYLVFTEVKFRTNTLKGLPQEAVDVRKIRKITRTAEYYMLTCRIPADTPCRFDVIVILGHDITLIRNAFEAIR